MLFPSFGLSGKKGSLPLHCLWHLSAWIDEGDVPSHIPQQHPLYIWGWVPNMGLSSCPREYADSTIVPPDFEVVSPVHQALQGPSHSEYNPLAVAQSLRDDVPKLPTGERQHGSTTEDNRFC